PPDLLAHEPDDILRRDALQGKRARLAAPAVEIRGMGKPGLEHYSSASCCGRGARCCLSRSLSRPAPGRQSAVTMKLRSTLRERATLPTSSRVRRRILRISMIRL